MSFDASPAPEPPVAPDARQNARFYVVSSQKFLVLYFMTMGAYELYWFYKNWRLLRDSTNNAEIWPIARGVFAIFFVHALYREVAAKDPQHSRVINWSPSSSATMLVVLMIGSRLMERLSANDIGVPITNVLYLLSLVPLALLMWKAQYVINGVCGDPDGESNDHYTAANYCWIVLGAFVWLIVLAGLRQAGA